MQSATKYGDELDRVTDIFGGPLVSLSAENGAALLAEVIKLLEGAANQPVNTKGDPGGIVTVPAKLRPILIGDLHTRLNNLLTILCSDNLLNHLDEGTACLLFLGDAVHCDEPEGLEAMDSSVLMMDLIFKLMLRYPGQVFYVLGNHDSFSEEIVKEGVPQGQLWEKHLLTSRGETYRDQMARFYHLSPMVALADDFLACHAGPPREKVSCEVLVNLHENPRIASDLVWNRMSTPGNPMGYSRSDVKRFRKSLKLDKEVAFIVAHSPHAGGVTAWENIGNIPNHHLVYSALEEQVGIFTRRDGQLVPQVYPAETLLEVANLRARGGNGNN